MKAKVGWFNCIKAFLTFIILIAIIGSFLYWIGNKADQEKINRIERVEEGYGYSKGIITNISSYKGHSIELKYDIDGVDYGYTGGWDHNPKKLNIGDSISFKYSINEPKQIITELETKY